MQEQNLRLIQDVRDKDKGMKASDRNFLTIFSLLHPLPGASENIKFTAAPSKGERSS